MHSNRSRGTLMSYGDHSAQRRFKSNAPKAMRQERQSGTPGGNPAKAERLMHFRGSFVYFGGVAFQVRGLRSVYT